MRSAPSTALELFQPGLQSAFDPHGPHADAVATLAWVMFSGAALIFIVVLALAALAVWAPHRMRAWGSGTRFVLATGLAFPLVTLGALLVYALSLSPRVAAAPQPGDLKIEIVAEQWWWRVHYLDADGRVEFATANEVHLPVGQPVELVLKAADVIHSFWVPGLAGKADMIPGRVRSIRVTAARPGLLRGQCAEYCGGPHALMALYVLAQPRDEFAAWHAAQRRPANDASAAAAGGALFVAHCGVCHTVRGTPASGTRGPDLTHVASRRSLAAGVLPNERATLTAWIAGSQQIKPGNLMPSMNVIGGAEVRAIADYLEQLD